MSMTKTRSTEFRVKAVVGEILNMSERDRVDTIARLCARLSFEELDALVAVTRVALAKRGGVQGGYRADRSQRPKGADIEPLSLEDMID